MSRIRIYSIILTLTIIGRDLQLGTHNRILSQTGWPALPYIWVYSLYWLSLFSFNCALYYIFH